MCRKAWDLHKPRFLTHIHDKGFSYPVSVTPSSPAGKAWKIGGEPGCWESLRKVHHIFDTCTCSSNVH